MMVISRLMRQGTLLGLLLLFAAPVALALAIGVSTGVPAGPGSAGPVGPSGGPGTEAEEDAASQRSAQDVGTTAAGDDADLSISKADSVDPVAVGSTFLYYLNYTNNGPDRANSIVVTDTLPAGVTYVSGTGGCSHSSGVVTCTRNNLNAGNSASFVITVTASTVGNWTNSVTIDSVEDDPVPSNNADTEVTRIVTAPPSGLTCAANPSGVQLDWNSVAQATGYNVYRRTGSSGDFVLLASTTASEHLDSTAAVGQSYQYRVTSLSATGESAPSEICTVASVPELPTFLAGALALVGSIGAFTYWRRR